MRKKIVNFTVLRDGCCLLLFCRFLLSFRKLYSLYLDVSCICVCMRLFLLSLDFLFILGNFLYNRVSVLVIIVCRSDCASFCILIYTNCKSYVFQFFHFYFFHITCNYTVISAHTHPNSMQNCTCFSMCCCFWNHNSALKKMWK